MDKAEFPLIFDFCPGSRDEAYARDPVRSSNGIFSLWEEVTKGPGRRGGWHWFTAAAGSTAGDVCRAGREAAIVAARSSTPCCLSALTVAVSSRSTTEICRSARSPRRGRAAARADAAGRRTALEPETAQVLRPVASSPQRMRALLAAARAGARGARGRSLVAASSAVADRAAVGTAHHRELRIVNGNR